MCKCTQTNRERRRGAGNYEYTFECTKGDGTKKTVKVTSGNDSEAKQLAELECGEE